MCLCQLTYFFGFMIILQSSILLLVLACTNLTGLCCISLEDSQSSTSSPCEKNVCILFYFQNLSSLFQFFLSPYCFLTSKKGGFGWKKHFFCQAFVNPWVFFLCYLFLISNQAFYRLAFIQQQVCYSPLT